jgi:hypothetical protein
VAIDRDDLAEASTLDLDSLTEIDTTGLHSLRPVSYYWPSTPPCHQVHILVCKEEQEPFSWLSFTPIPSKNMRIIVDNSIPSIRKEMERYLGEDVQLPLWELQEDWPVDIREHVSSLKIPKISQRSHDPCLLLHGLAETPLEPDREQVIEKLFNPWAKKAYVQQYCSNMY